MLIDGTELRTAAQSFVTDAIDTANGIRRILGMIDSLGDVYGGDSQGQQAKAGFDKARSKLVSYVNALTNAYGEVGLRLEQMADNVGVANWDTIAALPKVDQ